MSEAVCVLRELLWSDLCTTDTTAYQSYLVACEKVVQDGFGAFAAGVFGGPGQLPICGGGGRCVGVGVVDACVRCRCDEVDPVVGGDGIASGAVGAEDHGDRGGREETSHESGVGGISGGVSGGSSSGVRDSGVDDSVPSDDAKRRPVVDTPVDDGSMGRRESTPLSRGKNYEKNQARRVRAKLARRSWRSGDSGVGMSSDSAAGSVQTVDTRTGVEIEAAQTLAARRVAENKVKIVEAEVAAKLAEHRLRALNDKARTLVIDRLAAARLEEKINTTKKKSQASFKECGSPIESVGSALSAHEFAFKQQVRQIDAEKKKVAYMEVQLKRYHSYSPDYVNQLVADIPEPYIPTEREMEEEDSDESPFLSYEEMQAEAANYQHG